MSASWTASSSDRGSACSTSPGGSDRLRTALEAAGLREVEVDTVTWERAFRSAEHFWEAVTSSNPIGAQMVADLTNQQRSDVERVIDGMLRERSGGRPGAVLTTQMNVALGTA